MWFLLARISACNFCVAFQSVTYNKSDFKVERVSSELSFDHKAAQRRRLLRGLVGGPAIYTLPLGAAVSAASLGCVDKSGTSTIPRPLLKTSPDTWVRVKLQIFKHGNDSYVVLGGTYYKLTTVVGGYTAALDGYTGSGAQAQSSYLYGLVDYSGGAPTIYPADQVIGQPVAGASCWNSVVPTPKASTTDNTVVF